MKIEWDEEKRLSNMGIFAHPPEKVE